MNNVGYFDSKLLSVCLFQINILKQISQKKCIGENHWDDDNVFNFFFLISLHFSEVINSQPFGNETRSTHDFRR